MPRQIDLVGVPSEAGAQNGTSGGPDALSPVLLRALRDAGVSAAYDNIEEHADTLDLFNAKGKPRGKVRYQKKVAQIAALTSRCVLTSLCRGNIPVVLGGDHSVAIGSGRAALQFSGIKGKKIGLLWIDAHYEAHPHETPHSHPANGLPLATLLGFGPKVFRPAQDAFAPENVLHLGACTADCEPEERRLLRKLKVSMFPAKKLMRNPMPGWIAALDLFKRVDLVWVSFDLDAMNQADAPAVHLRNKVGLNRAFLLWLVTHIAIGKKLCGVDIVEYKPGNEEYDENGIGKTAILASEFLLLLLML